MVTIVGICHEYQLDRENLPDDIEHDKKRYIDPLRDTVDATRATLISEETFPDDSRSLAKQIAAEKSTRYVVVDMNPAESQQRGIPERYSDYDTSCTRNEIDKFHRLREQFMVGRLLDAQTGNGNSILVCGSSHTYRLAALLRRRGVKCNPTTLVGAVPLENTEQLADIPEAEQSLTLIWDSVWSEERGDRPQTVIRHGERVLFSEPANWQAVTNGEYESICKILKQK